MSGSSKIYAPYNVLGLVNDGTSTECLPAIHRQGLSSFITTPVDDARALHLYDINLKLKGVTPSIPRAWMEAGAAQRISHIAAFNELTFVALGSIVGVYFRFRPFCIWSVQETTIRVLGMAGNVLVSVGKDGRLVAWLLPSGAKDPPSKEGDAVADFRLPMEFDVSCFAHPPLYKNKILLGTRDGRCVLVNLKTSKIVHVFSGFGSSVTALEPAPVLDVLAVGTAEGDIHVHNFRVDETIVSFKHTGNDENNQELPDSSQALGVHAITFRSDADESMLTADGNGNLYVWDLNEKSLRCEAGRVHGNGGMLAKFLPGEPILVSAGLNDNSVKVHIFEDTNGRPRILRSRDGHHLPPVTVRFCGHDGFSMVSAGMDREVRLVSAVNDARNRTFSQGKKSKVGGSAKKRRRVNVVEEDVAVSNKKLPPVLALVSCDRRERDGEYANIVTVHERMEEVHTWRLQHGVKYGHILKPPSQPVRLQLAFQRSKPGQVNQRKKRGSDPVPRRATATCAALSPCGTFAVVGMEDGRVHAYNLQSGRHIGAYDDSSVHGADSDSDVDESRWPFAHEEGVAGLAVDAFGDTFVSAGSEDKTLKVWNMHTRELLPDVISSISKIVQVEWCKVSDLLAVACEDFIVYVYDATTRKLARKFSGHRGPIADLCFDPYGRRIVSAAADSTIKVWDLPSGCLADTMRCSEAPTSVAMGPSGDYLATTHVNNLAVRMWVDKSKFGTNISDGKEEESVATLAEDDTESESSDTDDDDEKAVAEPPHRDANASQNEVIPLSRGIITLSGKPSSQWTVLRNLKEIRERNKPTQPAQKPASAPFFLPTKKGLHFEFDYKRSSDDEKDPSGGKNRQRYDGVEEEFELPPSAFGKLVIAEKYEEAGNLLSRLDPSGVDMEIRTVGGVIARRKAAMYFMNRLESTCDYELSHAHLSVFLRAHGNALAKDAEGLKIIAELQEVQTSTWEKLRASLDAVACLSAYFSGQV